MQEKSKLEKLKQAEQELNKMIDRFLQGYDCYFTLSQWESNNKRL